MLVTLLFGLWTNRASGPYVIGNALIVWVLLALLGWKVFGSAIHN